MKRIYILLLLFLPLSLNGFAQITFKGSAPNAVVVGEQFRVNYTLTTTNEKGKDVRLPEMSGIQVLYGPTLSSSGSSTNIINGSVSSSITQTYTYVLLADKEGEYTLPAATIKVGNSEYKSNELKIKVLPADQAAAAASANQQAAQESRPSGNVGNNDLFIRMHVSKSSVYENEGFLVTFKLYSLVDVNGFESMNFPEFEGFIAQEVELPDNMQWNLENYQGRNYRTVVIKQTILYPQRPGKITLNSGRFEANVRVRNSQQRSRSFFDDFFDTYSNVKKVLTTSPTTIDVKLLPTGKPASFTGAVGEYKMTSSISGTTLKANNPVTIKITLSGNGNIKMVQNPEIIFPNDFEIYDPKIDLSTKVSSSGGSGTKTIEYYAVPRYAGDFTIPKAEFSYFDLKSKTYKTLSTGEHTLHVTADDGSGTAPTIVSGATKEDIRRIGNDIRHIQTDGFHFQKGKFFFGTWEYGLWYIIPLLLFAGLFIIYRKQVKENANIALVRTKKANKVASRRLKQANIYLREDKREAFYEETLKAVWGYLSDKLSIPVANLTKDNVKVELTKYGAKEDLIQEFISILNSAEFARFAPAQSQDAMDEIYKQTTDAINKMENTIKK